MNNEVMFSSRNMNWETPFSLIRSVQNLLNLEFTLDVCARDERVTRAPQFYSPEQNALDPSAQWIGNCWMNPPYGKAIIHWVTKAREQAKEHGSTVVCLLPARTDTKFFHRVCTSGLIYLMEGRVVFEQDGKPLLSDKGQPMSAPFPSMLVVYKPRLRPGIKTWKHKV